MILGKFGLKGNVALVTGASQRLGQGMALVGADAVLVARTQSSLEETLVSAEKAGSRGFVV
jgi:short-subunit dehydrogenase